MRLWFTLLFLGLMFSRSVFANPTAEAVCGTDIVRSVGKPHVRVARDGRVNVLHNREVLLSFQALRSDLQYWNFTSTGDLDEAARRHIRFGVGTAYVLPFRGNARATHYADHGASFRSEEDYESEAIAFAQSNDPYIATLKYQDVSTGLWLLAKFHIQTNQYLVLNERSGRILSFYELESARDFQGREISPFGRFLSRLAVAQNQRN